MLGAFSGCSINQMAMRMKPETVAPAIPQVIEKNEAKLAKHPEDQDLILATGSLFVMYANVFVQGPAEMLPAERFAERQEELEKSKQLYLRGVEILTSGLELKYPGFGEASKNRETLEQFLTRTKEEDVPTLYWLVAGTLSAYAINPMDLELGFKIPALTALINRAYALDPDFNNGSIDEFFVLFYASLPESLGGDKSKVDTHFNLALEKSGGLSMGPYVSYAQAICIPAQDYDTFKKYLDTVLALNVNASKNRSSRLVNIIAQRKARYLLDRASYYFPDLEEGDWEDFDWENPDEE
jgi:predicted anti-sigma-YlaC factor YlaD